MVINVAYFIFLCRQYPMANISYIVFFHLLLLCFAGIIDASQILSENAMELEPLKSHKHKHAGFSKAECEGACTYRCSKTSHKKPCMFFCQKCCFKCRCVPPGTYANKQLCPCYNNWKTKRGGPKCP